MNIEEKLKNFISRIQPVSEAYETPIQDKLDHLTKPQGSLGFLEDVVKKLGGIQETMSPAITKKRVYTFAGDHGIAEENVSAYPASVTPQMVFNFIQGGAAISVLSKQFNLELRVVDVGVNFDFVNTHGLLHKKIAMGTKNFLHAPAMTRDQALQSFFVGIDLAQEAKEEGVDLLIAGDMGIGNTTSSSAITALLCGTRAEEVTSMGTGISRERVKEKAAIVARGIETRNPKKDDPIDILTQVGGFELGAIAGLALGCAYHKIALISDGFISTTGVALAYALCPTVRDILFPVECTTETGNSYLLRFLETSPVLSLDIRLGEGTGAALLVPLFEAGLKLYHSMATFESAGVDNHQ